MKRSHIPFENSAFSHITSQFKRQTKIEFYLKMAQVLNFCSFLMKQNALDVFDGNNKPNMISKLIQNKCKNVSDVYGITFDFKQSLQLPYILIQEDFYLRQLWLHEFCVNYRETGKTFFILIAVKANKGSDEVMPLCNVR